MVAVGAIALAVTIGLSELYDWLRERWTWRQELAERERRAAMAIEEITYQAQTAILTEAMRRLGVADELSSEVVRRVVADRPNALDR